MGGSWTDEGSHCNPFGQNILTLIFFSLSPSARPQNLLEELPPTVLELDQLRVLRLSGNKMTALPPQIRMLQQLEDLACDANEIAELHKKAEGLRGAVRDVETRVRRIHHLRH